MDAPNTRFRICMNRNVRKTTNTSDVIILHALQNRFFEPLPTFPLPNDISIPEAFGGRRNFPPPFFCLFRRRSPCSNLGGRLACSELIVQLLGCIFMSVVVLWFTSIQPSPMHMYAPSTVYRRAENSTSVDQIYLLSRSAQRSSISPAANNNRRTTVIIDSQLGGRLVLRAPLLLTG